MTQHKTLAECLEQTAQLHGYADWLQIDMTEDSECEKNEVKARLTMEAAKLFESQFVKKDGKRSMEDIINEYFSSRTPEQIKADYEKFEAEDRVNFPQDYKEKDESKDPETLLREYISFDDVNGNETVNILPLTIIDIMLEFHNRQKKDEAVSSDVETPISKAILEFERLKEKAPSIKDMVYLDGVLAVLDSMKDYERYFLINQQCTQQPATINWLDEKWIQDLSKMLHPINVKAQMDVQIGARQAQKELKKRVNCVDQRKLLRDLVDNVWSHVTESESVPSTKLADEIIDKTLNQTNPNGQAK